MTLHEASAVYADALYVIGVGLLIAAALRDVMTRHVPNAIPLAIAIIAAVLSAIQSRLAVSVICGLLVFALTVFCWWRGWLGGADAKLLGAAAILIPPIAELRFILDVTLIGAALSVVYLVARRLVPTPGPARPASLLGRVFRIESWRIRRGGPLPYACAIALGALAVLS